MNYLASINYIFYWQKIISQIEIQIEIYFRLTIK